MNITRQDGTIHPAVRTGAGVAAAIALAIPLVAAFEGFAAKPYVDRAGSGQPITYCYGETKADGPLPPLNKIFTKQECTAALEHSLETKYDPEVRKCIHVPLPPHREAALVSFVYNLGSGALCNGAIAHNLNAGNVVAACNAMLAFDHAAGRRLPGLTKRRQIERELCLRSD